MPVRRLRVLVELCSLRRRSATALLNASTEEVKVTLADQQADPNSPLYSAKTFEELGLCGAVQILAGQALRARSHRHPNLLKGLYGMKFSKPSKIQEKALPLLLAQPCVVRVLIGRGLLVRLTWIHLIVTQCDQHDRSIAVRHGQNGCIQPDHAQQD